MHCQRCGKAMRESPAVHHRKRKWICPKCGKVRMQKVDKVRHKGRGKRSGWED